MQGLKTVIMAGGKGSRIAGLWPAFPKPMIPLCGKPILQHQVECLVRQGFCDITLVVGYKAESITGHFGSGEAFGAHITYIREEMPLGTAGALAFLPRQDILLLMGDLYLDVNFKRFGDFHRETGAAVTLFAHPNSHYFDSDTLVTSADGRVSAWASKEDATRPELRNLVNAGLYMLAKEALPSLAVKTDLDKDVVAPRVGRGEVYAYRSTEYVKDMGTPERLARVEKDILAGVPAARQLGRPQKAVFIDRDGTLNRQAGFVRTPQELVLLPGAAQALARLNRSEYLAVCVTNQPVLARGEVSGAGLKAIHARLDMLLARQEGAYLDDLFFCPHHPHKGFQGEVPELKRECDCRKPKPGLLLCAAQRYNINLAESWMVGDAGKDILAGRAAGCRTIGLCGKGGQCEEDPVAAARPDRICENLPAAVEAILGG